MGVSSQTCKQFYSHIWYILTTGVVLVAAQKYIVKGVSKHDPDNATAMDTFYALFCPGELLKCITMSAGYADMDYSDFRWQKHYVHGRGVYGIERIQQERPDVWKIISEQLAPGLEEWVQAVMDKGLHGLAAQELKAANQAKLQWHLLEVCKTVQCISLSTDRARSTCSYPSSRMLSLWSGCWETSDRPSYSLSMRPMYATGTLSPATDQGQC